MTTFSMSGDTLYCGRSAIQTITYTDRLHAAEMVYQPEVAQAVAGGELSRETAIALGIRLRLLVVE